MGTTGQVTLDLTGAALEALRLQEEQRALEAARERAQERRRRWEEGERLRARFRNLLADNFGIEIDGSAIEVRSEAGADGEERQRARFADARVVLAEPDRFGGQVRVGVIDDGGAEGGVRWLGEAYSLAAVGALLVEAGRADVQP